MTVAQLRAATGKSQPSLSLAIAKLSNRVCKLGAARSTRYAVTQPMLGLPAASSAGGEQPKFVMQTAGVGSTGQQHQRSTFNVQRLKRNFYNADSL